MSRPSVEIVDSRLIRLVKETRKSKVQGRPDRFWKPLGGISLAEFVLFSFWSPSRILTFIRIYILVVINHPSRRGAKQSPSANRSQRFAFLVNIYPFSVSFLSARTRVYIFFVCVCRALLFIYIIIYAAIYSRKPYLILPVIRNK